MSSKTKFFVFLSVISFLFVGCAQIFSGLSTIRATPTPLSDPMKPQIDCLNKLSLHPGEFKEDALYLKTGKNQYKISPFIEENKDKESIEEFGVPLFTQWSSSGRFDKNPWSTWFGIHASQDAMPGTYKFKMVVIFEGENGENKEERTCNMEVTIIN